MKGIKIKEIDRQNAPMELLLLADPSEEKINEYLEKGNCFGAYEKDGLVGVYVLVLKDIETLEIMNIAVNDNKQGKGIGKLMILDAIERAKKFKAKKLVVGTGNSSVGQLAFYQKCGFKMAGIEKDYFIKNYPKPIFENGIQCKDMIRLEIAL